MGVHRTRRWTEPRARIRPVGRYNFGPKADGTGLFLGWFACNRTCTRPGRFTPVQNVSEYAWSQNTFMWVLNICFFAIYKNIKTRVYSVGSCTIYSCVYCRGQGVIHFRHSEFVHCAKVASMSIGVLLGKIIIWFFNFYSSDAGLREGACENAKHDNFIRSMSPHYWTRIAACLYDHYCDARSFIFLTFASQLRLPTVSGRQ